MIKRSAPLLPVQALVRYIMSRRVVVVLMLILATGRTRPAVADEPTDRAAFLFREGRQAMKGGDYALACSRFAESESAEPSPGVLLNLAVCEEKLGHLLRARDLVAQFMSTSKPDDGRRNSAEELAADLDARVPHLAILLQPGSIPEARVSIDEHEVTVQGVPIAVDPGQHVIEATAPGYSGQRVIVGFAEGKTISEVLSLVPNALPIARHSEAQPASAGAPLRPLFYTAVGVGLVGTLAVIGSGAGVMIESSRVADHCSNKICDEEGLAAARRGRELTTINTIAWPVALAGASLATYLFLTRGRQGGRRLAISASLSASSAYIGVGLQ